MRDKKDIFYSNILLKVRHAFFSDVYLSENVTHNASKLINLINLYHASKYYDKVNEGAVFWNIVNRAYKVMRKKIRLDVEEITLENPNRAINYLLKKAHKEFQDDYYMRQYFDDMVEQLSWYGTLFTLTIPGKYATDGYFEVLDLSKLMFDPIDYKKLPVVVWSKQSLYEVLNNKNYDTENLAKSLREKTGSVYVFAMYGYMATPEDEDDIKYRQVILVRPDNDDIFLRNEYSGYYVVSDVVLDEPAIDVLRINTKLGRTMGVGAFEESLEAQVNVNELANMVFDQLRSSRTYFMSSDKELDGLVLDERASNTFIYTNDPTDVKQVAITPVSVPYALGVLNQIVGQQHQDQMMLQDVALGKQVKGVPLGSTQIAKNEVDSDYGVIKYKLGLFVVKLYKKYFLRVLYKYFNSNKTLKQLLTKDEYLKFMNYLVSALSESVKVNMVLNDIPVISDDEIERKIRNDISNKNWDIYFENEISEKQIVDKTHVYVASDNNRLTNKIIGLNTFVQFVARNPELLKEVDLSELLSELLSLTDQEAYIETLKFGKKPSSQIAIEQQQKVINTSNNFGGLQLNNENEQSA